MNFLKLNIVTGLLLITFASNFLFAQDSLITDSRGETVPAAFLKNISVNLVNTPIKKAIHEIAAKGNFFLNYNENVLPGNGKITFSAESLPALFVLKKILAGYKIDVIVSKGGKVVLTKSIISQNIIQDQKFTISGFISDANSGEALVGTNIFTDDYAFGSSSNSYGYYSLTLPKNEYKMKFSFIGYKNEEVLISLNKNIRLDISLSQIPIVYDTVKVVSKVYAENKTTELGTVRLTPTMLSTIPILLGERDILRSLHLLPGVTNSREGDAGLYVRGGNADHNLILLDEAPIYNAFHTFGFFSVFNSDAIKNIKLIKGSAPPKYGGRLSSIVDIQMNEGNKKELNGVAGIGLIFSRLTLEGPFIKDRGSFLISGRRTYLDVFKLFSSDADADKARFFFYDFNLKTNYIAGPKDRIYLSGYFGRDVIGFGKQFEISWGNKTGTFRWNHIFHDKLFSNTSFVFSQFDYLTFVDENEEDFDPFDQNKERVELISKINDFTIKEDFQYFHDSRNIFNFGASYINHSFLPGKITVRGKENYDFTIGDRNAHEAAIYASHEYDYNEKIKINYGLRYNLFFVKGIADIFNINDIEENLDVDFHKEESKIYGGLAPRISALYEIDNETSLKFGYARNYQFIHMVSNSNSGTPLDFWQPSSNRIKPQSADQLTLGYFKNMQDYEFSTEAYYKRMNNLIDFKDGANIILQNYFESELAFGKGWSYGIELMLKKNIGKFSGWIGYSLSRSMRQFDEINNGEAYPAKYDRTHDFSIVANYELSEHWKVSSNWVYTSGYNTTIPLGKYKVDEFVVRSYSQRNAYRTPDYHRLDLSITYETSGSGVWNLTLYNAYARKNVYTMLFRENKSNTEMTEAVKYSLFSIVPSISYTMKF